MSVHDPVRDICRCRSERRKRFDRGVGTGPGPGTAIPGPWDPTVKKFSPDPNERFLKMSWGPGPEPRSRQKSSPQEIVTVRYFPDFSRPEVFERERTCKEVENCHRPTLTGSFLSRIPPVEVVGNRLFPQLRSTHPITFLYTSEIRKSATVFAINDTLLKWLKLAKKILTQCPTWSLRPPVVLTSTHSRVSRSQSIQNIPQFLFSTTTSQWHIHLQPWGMSKDKVETLWTLSEAFFFISSKCLLRFKCWIEKRNSFYSPAVKEFPSKVANNRNHIFYIRLLNLKGIVRVVYSSRIVYL